ncbi:spastin [Trichuris trichiura]|uniref:microtubule-severing ATPase n=1 Tax=Trichuris trichiura TaxID=36087 RepID=A0A077ZIE4_TRITR|nr:spastin [Trichuris trichiura]
MQAASTASKGPLVVTGLQCQTETEDRIYFFLSVEKSVQNIIHQRSEAALAYKKGIRELKNGLAVKDSDAQSADSRDSIMKNIDSKLKQIILEQIIKTDSSLSLDDVVGNEVAKKSLFETVVLPAKNPELFTGLRSPVQGVLLFGPPGNGKTMLVRSEMKKTFARVSYSFRHRLLLAIARAAQPSIIFIGMRSLFLDFFLARLLSDEIDSILRERSDSEHEVSRRLKTEFLLQFDGVNSKASDRVLVIGATNRPFDLDEAVLRRLPKRLYIPLPDKQERVKMLRMLLRQQKHALGDYAFNQIGDCAEGFSFSDLKVLAKEAAMEPLRGIVLGFLIRCQCISLELPVDCLKKIKVEQLRPLTASDFLNALKQCRPSVKVDHIKRLEEFNNAHGHTC